MRCRGRVVALILRRPGASFGHPVDGEQAHGEVDCSEPPEESNGTDQPHAQRCRNRAEDRTQPACQHQRAAGGDHLLGFQVIIGLGDA